MLTTERMILRRPTHQDSAAHFAIHADPATNLYKPSGPLTLRSESDEIIGEWLQQWERSGLSYWTACMRDDPDRVVGFGGVAVKILAGEARPNLYFRFSPSAWGRGLATELARSAITFAIDKAGHTEVFALIRPDNAPSIAVIRKLGMTFYGEIHDVPGSRPSLLFARQQTT